MSHDAPSTAERAGWRYFWDGWVICPECMALRGYTAETWRVPITYDTPIKAPQRCASCRTRAPCDSGRLPEGGDGTAPCEASQNGAAVERQSPTPSPFSGDPQ